MQQQLSPRMMIEHLASVEDFEVAEATYRVAMTKGVTIQDRQDGV
jgi:hypothetical protein